MYFDFFFCRSVRVLSCDFFLLQCVFNNKSLETNTSAVNYWTLKKYDWTALGYNGKVRIIIIIVVVILHFEFDIGVVSVVRS